MLITFTIQIIGVLCLFYSENLDVRNFSGKVQIDFDLLGENMGTLSAFRIEAKLNSLVKVPKSWGGWGIKEIDNA